MLEYNNSPGKDRLTQNDLYQPVSAELLGSEETLSGFTKTAASSAVTFIRTKETISSQNASNEGKCSKMIDSHHFPNIGNSLRNITLQQKHPVFRPENGNTLVS